MPKDLSHTSCRGGQNLINRTRPVLYIEINMPALRDHGYGTAESVYDILRSWSYRFEPRQPERVGTDTPWDIIAVPELLPGDASAGPIEWFSWVIREGDNVWPSNSRLLDADSAVADARMYVRSIPFQLRFPITVEICRLSNADGKTRRVGASSSLTWTRDDI